MKSKHTHLITALGMIFVVFVAMAMAQGDKAEKSCSSCPSASTCSSGSVEKSQCGPAVMNLPVYLDGPSALLAQAEALELTDEQIAGLQAVMVEARHKAVALLDDVQIVALGEVPSEPVVMGKKAAKACGSGCGSDAQCADKAKGCHEGEGKCGEKKGCEGCKHASSCSSDTACGDKAGCQSEAQAKSCCGSCKS